MIEKGDGGRVRDPLEESEGKAKTSGNREESMTESAKDAFGRGNPVRKPDPESQSDGSTDDDAPTPPSGQSSRSSGTESLGGETPGGADRKGPGGVEGESGST